MNIIASILAPSDRYPGRRVVVGYFLHQDLLRGPPVGARPVDGIEGAYVLDKPLTTATDLGCAKVTVAFDLDSSALLGGARCDGIG